MLLITNRVPQFDLAALSRIHLKVKYNDLTSKARCEVWRNCLAQAHTSHGVAKVSTSELERLSNTHFNGREARSHAETSRASLTETRRFSDALRRFVELCNLYYAKKTLVVKNKDNINFITF